MPFTIQIILTLKNLAVGECGDFFVLIFESVY